ncbi:MAG: hypothetical protein JWQ35_2448 [Bacteriovoracaceae bacterium]|nr:hypothetical protein [Bacteriovoracaceae bacterium]
MISTEYNKGFLKSMVGPAGAKRLVIWGVVVAALRLFTATTFADDIDKKPANEAEKSLKLHEIRMRQIPLLEQFLTKYKDSPQTADSLFRLAEAHYETGKYFEADGQHAVASEHNQKATKVLEELRLHYPQYPRLDEALFVLANSYIEVQQMEKAGSFLSEISEKFPKSPVLKQASLLLGDYYFGKSQFPKAEYYYQTAAQDPKIQSYVYYKLAWVGLNLNQPARALQYFEKVLALRSQAQNSGGDYTREAAKELIFPALDVYKVTGVLAYLQKTLSDPELIQVSLETLAKGLMQRSDYSRSSEVYAMLQSNYPQSAQTEEWVAAQLKAEEALGRTSQIGTLVAKLSSSSPGSTKVQSEVLNTAKKFHAEAQKATDANEKNRLFDLSIAYYKAFLQGSGTPDLTAQVHFYLGEALYSRNRMTEAVSEYEQSAQVQSDVQAKAGWNWFLTAEKLADGFHYQGKALQATSANDEKYLAAAQGIQSIAGITIDQKRKASYQSARLLYQLNDLERALPVFQALADRYSGSQEGKLSAQLVLDIYNLRGDFKNVAQYAKAYQANADSGTRAELGQLEQKALLKTIQNEELSAKSASGDAKLEALSSVAEHYLEFAKSHPQSGLVDAALWASFQNFTIVASEKAGTHDAAYPSMKASFDLLTSKYASSSFAPQAIALMGKFLSQRKMQAKNLQDFARYRGIWEAQMRKDPREQRGAMGMLVYKLSGDRERRLLLKEFASLPNSEDNHEAYAYVQLEKVKALRDKLDSVSLSSLKTLKKNTQMKIDLLDRLQVEVTKVVKLQIAAPALEALKVLGDGYMKMASSMRSAPIPKSIVGDNLLKYKGIVSDAAADFETKGREAQRLADEKSKEIDLSSI